MLKPEPEHNYRTEERCVIKEGFCMKKSGTAFLYRANWRRRWFVLTQDDLTLSYYKLVSNTYFTVYLYDTVFRDVNTIARRKPSHC